jgi:hypothetical protein
VAILAPAAMLAVGAAPSRAAASVPVAFPAAGEEEWEEEAGEWEVEDTEEEWEVGEEVEVEGEGGWEVIGEERRREAPESCTLDQVSARVVASERKDAVRLLVDYRSKKPTKVDVKYWLKGSRGALQLKPLRRRMSQHGSLYGVERLNAHEMSKVRAARAFVVDLDMAATPSSSSCERHRTRHLTAKRGRRNRTVWSEPAR